ncbi:reverse transcriptase domain-containing protein [Tanacetum coccineum]
MKSNQKKCSFGVKKGKFLGYMATLEGIRANPKKTKVVANMQSPKTLKEMQSLSGKLAALNRFLSSAERAVPFFKTLKNITEENKDDYRWTEDAEHAFQEMKKLIIELPTLTTPGLREMLYVYLAASKYEGKVLEDFINEVLVGTKHMEICNLADEESLEEWTLYTDITSSSKGVGASLILIDPTGTRYTYAIWLNFPSTNNEAEYEALLAGLQIAEKIKARALKVKVDSKLEVNTIVEVEEDNWMTPIIKCLDEGIWLVDENEARTLWMKISQYAIEEGVMSKKSYVSPMLRCVKPLQAYYIIMEVHEGACKIGSGESRMGRRVGIKSLLEFIAVKISLLEDMDSKSSHMVAASKVPMLIPKNGNTTLKTTVMEGVEKVIPPTTDEEKAQKKLEVKARSTLMMGIPNEHQLKFNYIKDAKLLLEAIEKSSETLDQTFDRLQKLVSQLEILETMSMDDLYNNLKVYEPEVKGISSSNTSTQNMAFVSSNNSGSTNEAVITAHGVFAISTQVSAANSTNVDNLSDAVISAFFSHQPNNPQLANKDLQQLHPNDLEEIDLR